jgi:hypothetical protein
MRKVVQISMAMNEYGKYFVLALCDDGTLWQLEGLHEGIPSWKSFPVPPPSRAKDSH